MMNKKSKSNSIQSEERMELTELIIEDDKNITDEGINEW